MPKLEASVSRIKSALKSGNFNTGATSMACFNVRKASVAAKVHEKAALRNRSVRGAVMEANPRIKRR